VVDKPAAPTPASVCVFGPSTIVTVTIEDEGSGGSAGEVHFHAGGQGFWVARLLGRLGVPTTLCTAFGGEVGRVARALVEVEPITVRSVGTHDPNGAWIHDRRSGERDPVVESPGRPLARHAADELYGATLAAGLEAGVCVLTGSNWAPLVPVSQYERLASDLRANGVLVLADLSGTELTASLAGGLDFCKVSDEDLAGTHPLVLDDPIGAARQVQREGAANVAITRGDRGVLVAVGDEVLEVRPPRLEAVDHRGAGDAFTAVVAAATYWGMDWHDAVRWGTAAGALTVVRRGLATADRRDIHQLLGRVETRVVT
jgi:1-phosphofructokinase